MSLLDIINNIFYIYFNRRLKNIGFRFSPKKIAWYYRKEEDTKKYRFNSDYSLGEIKQKYGTKYEKRTVKLANNN